MTLSEQAADLLKRLQGIEDAFPDMCASEAVTLIQALTEENERLTAEMLAWRIAMQRLTPGGSEFMTPQACEEYAATLKRETVEAKLDRVRTERKLAEIHEIASNHDWHPYCDDIDRIATLSSKEPSHG
jgi:hypothetical protein